MQTAVGLVPLDGSATAECVLPWARTLGKALGLRLVLLSLVRDAPVGGDARTDAALRPARHYLDGVTADLTAAGLSVEQCILPATDDVSAQITSTAAALNASFILLATHGRTGVRRLVLGSVAGEVARTAPCPVLVIRATPAGAAVESGALRRILLPLDGSPLAEQALAPAVELARATSATLDLARVEPWAWQLQRASVEVYYPPDFDSALEQAADEYLARVRAAVSPDVTTECHVLRGDAAGTITAHAEEVGADLVVMSTRGRSGLARMTLGSVADRVVRGGSRPVLLVQAASTPPVRAMPAERAAQHEVAKT